jgi:hypothetical protein
MFAPQSGHPEDADVPDGHSHNETDREMDRRMALAEEIMREDHSVLEKLAR